MTSPTGPLAAALERLDRRLAEIPRRRARIEAPQELTNAYAAFLFAAGFARLGDGERARLRSAEAVAVLEPRRADPIHAALTAAFAARVEQAPARRPWHVPLPGPVIEQLNALSRMERYKVDRLREALPTLETEPLDAIGGFALRDQPPLVPPPVLVALIAVGDPTARAARIAEHLAHAASTPPGERAPLLAACLDAMIDLPTLPEARGIPLLGQAAPLLDGLPPELHVHALAAAARLGWSEPVPALAGSLRALLALLPSGPLEAIGPLLSPALRALRGLGLRDELATLLAAVEPLLGPERDREDLERRHAAQPGGPYPTALPHRGFRMVRAGCLALLGDPRGQALLEDAHAAVEQTTHPSLRLELIRDLTRGYAHAPLDLAIDRILALAEASCSSPTRSGRIHTLPSRSCTSPTRSCTGSPASPTTTRAAPAPRRADGARAHRRRSSAQARIGPGPGSPLRIGACVHPI